MNSSGNHCSQQLSVGDLIVATAVMAVVVTLVIKGVEIAADPIDFAASLGNELASVVMLI
jgi:hypothetical protein